MVITITIETSGVEVERKYHIPEEEVYTHDWNEKMEDIVSTIIESQYI